MQTYNSGNLHKYISKNPLKRVVVNRLNEKIITQIVEMIGDRDPSQIKLLDAGCGEGFIDRLILAGMPDLQITGLEYTSEALAIAKQMNPQIQYLQGDIYDMPFADNSFDIVICTEVLEHLQDPDRALKEIQRVSRGNILLTVPHEPWFRLGNVLVGKNLSRLGDPIDHVNHWSRQEFVRFCRQTVSIDWKLIGGTYPWTMVCA